MLDAQGSRGWINRAETLRRRIMLRARCYRLLARFLSAPPTTDDLRAPLA